MKSIAQYGYNERLFSGGFRGKLHLARFEWMNRCLRRYNIGYETVLELGCFDGKLIDFLPHSPKRYLGLDADWEGGLGIAQTKWANHPEYQFRFCSTPEQMQVTDGPYDLAVAMETMEHIPPHLVDGYLAELARCTRSHLFLTVPNEKGALFVAKWAIKRAMSSDYHPYTKREFMAAALGQMHKVERDNHKGFDYMALARQVGKYFDVVEVSGHPLGSVTPRSLCFGVGILAKARKSAV